MTRHYLASPERIQILWRIYFWWKSDMAEKQKIPTNAHECDIYKPARNFLMVRNSISSLRSTCQCTFVLRFIKSTKGVRLDTLLFRYFYCFRYSRFPFLLYERIKERHLHHAFTSRFSIRCIPKLKFYYIFLFFAWNNFLYKRGRFSDSGKSIGKMCQYEFVRMN